MSANNCNSVSQQQPKKLRLPIELHSEWFKALPVLHGANLLSLNSSLSRICEGRVRAQFEKWKSFAETRVLGPTMRLEHNEYIYSEIKALEAKIVSAPREAERELNNAKEGINKLCEEGLVEKWKDYCTEQAIRQALEAVTRGEAMSKLIFCMTNLNFCLKRMSSQVLSMSVDRHADRYVHMVNYCTANFDRFLQPVALRIYPEMGEPNWLAKGTKPIESELSKCQCDWLRVQYSQRLEKLRQTCEQVKRKATEEGVLERIRALDQERIEFVESTRNNLQAMYNLALGLCKEMKQQKPEDYDPKFMMERLEVLLENMKLNNSVDNV